MNDSISGQDRRRFLKGGAALVGALALPSFSESVLHAKPIHKQPASAKDEGFRSLFDGTTLNGWTRKERDLKRPSLGKWFVHDGMIVGGQETPGFGSYLVSDETFADFEVEVDALPDWRVDTGIYVRTAAQGNVGFQTLIDYRPHGGIGGYFGNWVGNFHAVDYCFNGEVDTKGNLVRLIPEKPSEPLDAFLHVPLDYSAPAEEFIRNWNLHGWNKFRVRSVGEVPHLTTWINGLKVAELDTAKMKMKELDPAQMGNLGFKMTEQQAKDFKAQSWDPAKVVERVGRKGHIALEVHDNMTTDWLGVDRWAPGAVCRWRNIRVRTL